MGGCSGCYLGNAGNFVGLVRPDLVGGSVYLSHGDNVHWLNPAAFVAPALGTVGTVRRNSFRGPGINNWDMTLIKRIPLGGDATRNIRLRVEAYNVFNHTQFNAINTAARFDGAGNQINSQFGQAIGARQPRVLQLGATLSF